MPTLRKQIAWCARTQWTLGAVVIIALVGFYFFGYRPQTQRLAVLRATAIARQAELEENQRRAARRNEIALKNERLRTELERIKKPSKRQELPELIKDLERGKEQASLRKYEQKAGVPMRSDLYCELPISMTFEGDFTSVFNFLRSTEEIQRLTRVRNLKLKAKPDGTGQVHAGITMNIYFSTE
jgi:Tfp pilus assembly protein PilO